MIEKSVRNITLLLAEYSPKLETLNRLSLTIPWDKASELFAIMKAQGWRMIHSTQNAEDVTLQDMVFERPIIPDCSPPDDPS